MTILALSWDKAAHRKSAAWPAAHRRKLRAGAPVICCTMDVTSSLVHERRPGIERAIGEQRVADGGDQVFSHGFSGDFLPAQPATDRLADRRDLLGLRDRRRAREEISGARMALPSRDRESARGPGRACQAVARRPLDRRCRSLR
jgi:hypothetical protein